MRNKAKLPKSCIRTIPQESLVSIPNWNDVKEEKEIQDHWFSQQQTLKFKVGHVERDPGTPGIP